MYFKYVAFIFLSFFVLSGCGSQSPSPFNINSSEVIDISSTKDKNYKKVYFLINSIKLDYEDSIKKTEFFNIPPSNIPGVNHNLIWIVGPDPSMSRNMFHIKKYVEDNLMIEGAGIKEKTSFLLKKIYNVNNPDLEAKKMGYSSFKEMFNVVFERVSNEPTSVLIENLLKLKRKGLIDTSNVFVTVSGFKKKLNKFIYYANEEYFYYMYGDKKENINAIKILNDSKFYILNKFNEPIYLESKDYEIYSFVLDLCYEFIKKNKRGKGIDVL